MKKIHFILLSLLMVSLIACKKEVKDDAQEPSDSPTTQTEELTNDAASQSETKEVSYSAENHPSLQVKYFTENNQNWMEFHMEDGTLISLEKVDGDENSSVYSNGKMNWIQHEKEGKAELQMTGETIAYTAN